MTAVLMITSGMGSSFD
jgi:hypothetical protein